MDDVLKKRLFIGISVVCLITAIGICYSMLGKSSEQDDGGTVYLKCITPACNNVVEIDDKKLNELVDSENDKFELMESPGLTPVLTCPKCKKKSLCIAIKCIKCGNVFLPNYQNPDSYDKCPKCGSSQH